MWSGLCGSRAPSHHLHCSLVYTPINETTSRFPLRETHRDSHEWNFSCLCLKEIHLQNAISDDKALFLALFYSCVLRSLHFGLVRKHIISERSEHAGIQAGVGTGMFLGFPDECVSGSEGYQIETDPCRPPSLIATQRFCSQSSRGWVTATDIDGF